MSEVISTDDATARERAATALRDHGLVVAPTDTVYGVLADAFAQDATQRLLIAREGGRAAPLTVLIRSPRQIVGLTDDANEAADRLMAAFWPGPLTLVFTAGEALGWDLGDTRGTVALRMPADDLLHELIADIGPLACSGANRAGDPPPTTVEQAREALGDAVAVYLDAGTRDETPSTVVDVSRGGAEILRLGAISADEVVRVATGAVDWGAPVGEGDGPVGEPAWDGGDDLLPESEVPDALDGPGDLETLDLEPEAPEQAASASEVAGTPAAEPEEPA